MSAKSGLWIALLVALLACGKLDDDVAAMCTIPQDIEKTMSDAKADPSQRVRILLEHDGKVAHSRDGKALVQWLGDETRPAEERATRMQEEATKAHVSSCALVDEIRAQGKYNERCAGKGFDCK